MSDQRLQNRLKVPWRQTMAIWKKRCWRTSSKNRQALAVAPTPPGCCPRTPKTPDTPSCNIKNCRFANIRLHCSRNDELRYAHTTLNNKWLRTMVYENYMDFPPIIGVDRSRRIKDSDPMSRGQSRARADLAFGTWR
jgi:hypothetical protein